MERGEEGFGLRIWSWNCGRFCGCLEWRTWKLARSLGRSMATLPLQHGITSLALQTVSSRALSSIARSPALVSVAPRLQLQRFRPVTATPLASARGITSANSIVGSLGLANAGPWQSFGGLRAERVARRKDFVKTERSKRNYRTVPSAEARDGRVCLWFLSRVRNGGRVS